MKKKINYNNICNINIGGVTQNNVDNSNVNNSTLAMTTTVIMTKTIALKILTMTDVNDDVLMMTATMPLAIIKKNNNK